MKINQREKRLLAVLNILLWLWALKGLWACTTRWQEAIRLMSPPRQHQNPLCLQSRPRSFWKDPGFGRRSLPWPEEEAG